MTEQPYSHEIKVTWDDVTRVIMLDFRQGDADGQAYLGAAEARILAEALTAATDPGPRAQRVPGGITHTHSIRVTYRQGDWSRPDAEAQP
jgi:hypothetical protein